MLCIVFLVAVGVVVALKMRDVLLRARRVGGGTVLRRACR
jgi:hypothetical protein